MDAPLQKFKKALETEYHRDSYCKTTDLGGSINKNFNCYETTKLHACASHVFIYRYIVLTYAHKLSCYSSQS